MRCWLGRVAWYGQMRWMPPSRVRDTISPVARFLNDVPPWGPPVPARADCNRTKHNNAPTAKNVSQERLDCCCRRCGNEASACGVLGGGLSLAGFFRGGQSADGASHRT